MPIDFFIDGNPVQAEKGQTVMQAAVAAGVTIASFCWHPQLSVPGNCRICMVEVESDDGAWFDISCNMPVTSGMRVLSLVPSHHNHAIGESIGIRLDVDHVVVFRNVGLQTTATV